MKIILELFLCWALIRALVWVFPALLMMNLMTGSAKVKFLPSRMLPEIFDEKVVESKSLLLRILKLMTMIQTNDNDLKTISDESSWWRISFEEGSRYVNL